MERFHGQEMFFMEPLISVKNISFQECMLVWDDISQLGDIINSINKEWLMCKDNVNHLWL